MTGTAVEVERTTRRGVGLAPFTVAYTSRTPSQAGALCGHGSSHVAWRGEPAEGED